MTKEEFKKEIAKLNISYTEEMVNQLDYYAQYLLEYNKHTNLTAIRNLEDVYVKHFYDSLTLVKVVDLNECTTFLDIGSGAGFPGLVIKIFFPHIHVTLVDSNNKKTTFLQSVVDNLQLTNITIINNRIENIAPNYLNYFDIVTARAVTTLVVLCELALPLVKKNGKFIAMKANASQEIKESTYCIEVLKSKIKQIESFDLFTFGKRTLISIEKLENSLPNILRPYDKIIKKPLQKGSK